MLASGLLMKKIFYFVPVILLTACSSADVNLEQNQRLESLEEKVDALLVYNNKTYDILVDNELRLSEVEKDAQKRGVPVPQKIVTVDSLKQPNYGTAPAVTAQAEPQNLPVQNAQQVSQVQQSVQVGSLTGQDLTKAEEKTQKQVKENVVQPPKQAAQPAQTAQVKKDPVQPQTAQPDQSAQAAAAQPAQTPQEIAARASSENVAQVSGIASSSKQLYDNAYQLYQKRQFAQSEMAFDAFLEQYPQDVLAPNALYWKGETLYARALYPQAIFAFKEVQTRYPKHPKTADSLLKTAMSYARLGDNENASLHYLVLLEDWPQSQAAQKARAMGAK